MQADLSLRWEHMSGGAFSHVATYIILRHNCLRYYKYKRHQLEEVTSVVITDRYVEYKVAQSGYNGNVLCSSNP